jgi:hypothetical protein
MPETKSNTADLYSTESNQGTTECKHCLAQSQREFSGELALHFKGLAGLDKPIVWLFPNLLVCLQCGFAELTVPKQELQVLRGELSKVQ